MPLTTSLASTRRESGLATPGRFSNVRTYTSFLAKMRAGGCAVQQALAPEAASVVRQAVTLARRRGHAQVTPLHVATAMLLPPAPAGLLRAACLRSHSHPLQCKALELCFNVALNRLPTSGPAAMFHGGAHMQHHHHHRGASDAPALSNALVAAFKRAQAHQRRGGAGDGVQQTAAPVLTAKVELEQLIVSILDDPSVSRVMREAGFSSSQVKDNVEKAVSSASPSLERAANMTTTSSIKESRAKSAGGDDAMRVLECMASGTKRCLVVVGEGAEAAVKAVMDKVSKSELHHRHHERLKSVQFVPLSVTSFRHATREQVEAKTGELRALVCEARAAGKGVALVVEDLAYAADAWHKRRGEHVHGGHSQYYCPVEHAVMEVSGLVSGDSGSGGGRFWLLGFASRTVFMKCRVGQPSLEAVWGIHPLVVPDGGSLALSLSCTIEAQASQQAGRSITGWPLVNGAAITGESELTWCARTPSPEPNIPSWLRRYHDPYHTTPTSSSTSLQQLQDLWNPVRNWSATHHHTSELTLSFSSPTSPAASSLSGYNNNPMTMSSSKPCHPEPRKPWPPSNQGHDGPATRAEAIRDLPRWHNTEIAFPESITVQSNSPNGHGGGTADPERRRPKFTELTAENLKIMCGTLEDCVPWHIKDMAAGVASAVLQRRSGMARQRDMPTPSSTTWLLFKGSDRDGKKSMALEIAKLVFGSYNDFISMSSAGCTPVHSSSSSGELSGKRQRSPDYEHSCAQRFYEAIRENPRRVLMIDDVEQMNLESEIGIKKAIASGRARGCNGVEISLEDAIVVLSCEAFDSRSRASSPRVVKQKVICDEEYSGGVEKGVMKPPCFSLDLNEFASGDDEGHQEEEGLDSDVEICDVVDGVFFFRLPGDLSH
ncbi:protein SMAX1-LIKE 3-like [Triticum urartu]|nr:protein SMAX1-LIKE 3-like [Triticum urartu]